MSTRPTLPDFIDDELLRAPMTIDLVIDTVLQRWRERMVPMGRHDADPARVLQMHRNEVVSAALAHLRTAAVADGSPGIGHLAAKPAAAAPQAMSLIDEDDVAVDIEIARCVETIRLKAELEVRELQTYTSALVNDLGISRDTNPFRPDRFVRALWAGVQTLPMSRAVQAAFLHEAAVPLAETLRKAYAAASRRLEDQGVTPAIHRTIVVGGGTAWGSQMARQQAAAQMGLNDSIRATLDALPEPTRFRSAAMPVTSTAAQHGPAADAQMIELLARLFEALQSETGLGTDTLALLQRLEPLALRVALRDPSLLDRYDHPVWRFMDQLAHDIETSPPAQRLRVLGLGRNLIDHLAQTDHADPKGFEWALARLMAAQRSNLMQAMASCEENILRLQRIADAEAPPTTSTMPLDIGTLDTVPAALMPDGPAKRPMVASDALAPGSLLRVYLQGEWRTLMALWQDHGHELALLRDAAADRQFAVRQGALSRLLAEGLAQPLQVRSLVRRAAGKVLRAS